MAKAYDTITVNVVEHPGSRGTYIVQATRYVGDDYDQDDAEEIRGIEDALSYAVTNAKYYRDEYPGASVIVIDDDGNEYWPTRLGAKRGSKKPARKSRKRTSRKPKRGSRKPRRK